MKIVRISRSRLKDIIVRNRAAHEVAFNKAMEGYNNESIQVLEKALEALKGDKQYVVKFDEQAPVSHLDDYDRVLKMLDLSEDNVIELTQGEFMMYVEDDWDWKRIWTFSNSKYIS